MLPRDLLYFTGSIRFFIGATGYTFGAIATLDGSNE